MSVNPEAIAKLIEATMKDSEGHRAEILERAGEGNFSRTTTTFPRRSSPTKPLTGCR